MIDRIIGGGIQAVTIGDKVGKQLGVSYFLERRELGVINIGGPGMVAVDGTRYEIGHEEALYVGQGARNIRFESINAGQPALFYYNSAPAHTAYSSRKITLDEATPQTISDNVTSNRRTIHKFIVPDVLPTCQLTMGLTKLAEGNL